MKRKIRDNRNPPAHISFITPSTHFNESVPGLISSWITKFRFGRLYMSRLNFLDWLRFEVENQQWRKRKEQMKPIQPWRAPRVTIWIQLGYNLLLLPHRATLPVIDSQTLQIGKIASCIVAPLSPYLAGKQWCNGRDHVGRYCEWILISWFLFYFRWAYKFLRTMCYVSCAHNFQARMA